MIELILDVTLKLMTAATVAIALASLYLAYHIRRGADIEFDSLLALLALIASVAPYVGLFGTVWHIIQALGGIGGASINVAAIAKPIGLALYATLWGLGTAILALVAHKACVLLVASAGTEGEPAAPLEPTEKG